MIHTQGLYSQLNSRSISLYSTTPPLPTNSPPLSTALSPQTANPPISLGGGDRGEERGREETEGEEI